MTADYGTSTVSINSVSNLLIKVRPSLSIFFIFFLIFILLMVVFVVFTYYAAIHTEELSLFHGFTWPRYSLQILDWKRDLERGWVYILGQTSVPAQTLFIKCKLEQYLFKKALVFLYNTYMFYLSMYKYIYILIICRLAGDV